MWPEHTDVRLCLPRDRAETPAVAPLHSDGSRAAFLGLSLFCFLQGHPLLH